MIHPGGEAEGSVFGPDDAELPVTPLGPGEKRVRVRDLPKAEILRRKVQDTVRYYGITHGRLLTVEALGNYIGWRVRHVGTVTADQIAAALNDPVTVSNLRELGLLPEDVFTWSEALEARVRPDGTQMDALDAIFTRINPDDTRPLDKILAEQGIELKTWNGWLADPIFAGYVRQRTEQVFGERAHEVDIALMRKAIGGDTGAIKLILQLQGRLAERTGPDPGVLLGRVLDVLLEEIGDEAVLERIARRLEAIAQAAQVRPQITGSPLAAPVILGEQPDPVPVLEE
jgi:hypothetical protein